MLEARSGGGGGRQMSLAEVCVELRNLQTQRWFCIGQQSRLNNALGSLARWHLGFNGGLPEKEREAIRKKADALLSALRKGKEVPRGMEDAAEALAPFVLDTAAVLEPFDVRRKNIEKAMVKLVAETPGAGFAAEVRGFGMLGLAIVIGEAGNLSDYGTVAKLWKYLGWAPADEYPQGEKSTGRKIPRRRKGELYGVIVEPMMKLNDGKYRAVYLERKAEYLARFTADGSKAPKLHAHKLAMRVMLKELLKDLYLHWNAA